MGETTKRPYNWTKGSTPPHERILARIDSSDPDACWFWPGAFRQSRTRGVAAGRYGCIAVGSRTDGTRRRAATHIVMFEHFVGPVPAGYELDHLCSQTLCCNYRHLEPVTHDENCRRAAKDHLLSLQMRLALAREIKAAM